MSSQLPSESNPQQSIVRRRKVTTACDACRKRRAKCSGDLPCTLCQQYKRACSYDNKSRGRRGPKPRQPPIQLPKLPRQLPLISPRPAEVTDWWNIEHFSPSQLPFSLLESTEDTDGSDNDEDQDGTGQFSTGLEKILYNKDFPTLNRDTETLYLVSHLLELFWSHASAHLTSVMSHEDFVKDVQNGSCSRSLVFSMCANSVRFSTHPAAKQPSSEAAGLEMAKWARREATMLDHNRNTISLLQTYSCLAEFEMNSGNGSNAWLDIAMGKGLLQLSRSNKNNDPATQVILQQAEYFLTTNELCYGLNTGDVDEPMEQAYMSSISRLGEDCLTSNHTAQFVCLMRTLVRVKHLFDTPPRLHDPPPWHLQSQFQALQGELETYLIRFPNIYGSNPVSSRTMVANPGMEEMACALIWHCCVITMNRIFLPIISNESKCESHSQPTVDDTSLLSAPAMFLRESNLRCEGSAITSIAICKEIVASGGFFHYLPWLGFSCLSSSLVLMNQSRQDTSFRNKFAEALKLNIGFLTLVGEFFPSAKQWVVIVSRVQRNPKLPTIQVENAFDSFFTRFEGVEEPNFIPLERYKGDGDSSMEASTREAPSEVTSLSAGMRATQLSWAEGYADFLVTEYVPEDEDKDERPVELPEMSNLRSVASTSSDISVRRPVSNVNAPPVDLFEGDRQDSMSSLDMSALDDLLSIESGALSDLIAGITQDDIDWTDSRPLL